MPETGWQRAGVCSGNSTRLVNFIHTPLQKRGVSNPAIRAAVDTVMRPPF